MIYYLRKRVETMHFPTTRTTLLDKLSAHDENAWMEFFRAYQPVIRDIGVFKGLTPDECDELQQNAMIRFQHRVDDGFRYNASLAHFRTYFGKLIRGCVCDLLRKRRDMTGELPELPDENSPDELLDRLLLEKWRMFLFRQALEKLKTRVNAQTYQIFDLAVLQHEPAENVAELLQVKKAYVYLAAGRCKKHLKEIAAELNRQDGELDFHV